MASDTGWDRVEGVESAPILALLAEANEVVMGARQREYGSPSQMHRAVATVWTAYLKKRGNIQVDGRGLDEEDVVMMMILLKVMRGPWQRDSWRDIAGYAAIGADLL